MQFVLLIKIILRIIDFDKFLAVKFLCLLKCLFIYILPYLGSYQFSWQYQNNSALTTCLSCTYPYTILSTAANPRGIQTSPVNFTLSMNDYYLQFHSFYLGYQECCHNTHGTTGQRGYFGWIWITQWLIFHGFHATTQF